MSALSLNSSHVGSLPPASQQAWPRKPSDQKSQTSNQSTNTIQRNPHRKVSASSNASLSSHTTGPLRVVNQNVISSRNGSNTSLIGLESRKNLRPKLHLDIPQNWSPFKAENSITSQAQADSSLLAHDGTTQGTDSKTTENTSFGRTHRQEQSRGPFSSTRNISQTSDHSNSSSFRRDRNTRPTIIVTSTVSNPYKKLLDELGTPPTKGKPTLSARKQRWSLDDFDEETITNLQAPKPDQLNGHRKASSWSSNGFIAAVKSTAPGSGQSNSIHRSEKGSKMRFFRRKNRNSRSSDATQRASVDSGQQILDEAAHIRAVQRRKVIEELLASEEGYINDLKILAHVYLTILGSTSQFPRSMQFEVERNLDEILMLHEEILVHMKLFHRDAPSKPYDSSTKHLRFNSVDSADAKRGKKGRRVARRSLESVWFRQSKHQNLTSEPQEAADIARVFGRMLPRFFAYEEYGARYESTLQLVASTSKSIPNWWAFERGIEALMNSILPRKPPDDVSKKGLTLEDLLIKPIQRICRYPLLIAELHRNTLAGDDKEAEAAIQKVLSRMRETAQEINKAANDSQTKARMQRSWKLQDLLFFPDHAPIAHSILRTLGHAKVCGVLFVVYQSHEELRGDYTLCALFNAHLLLALPESGNKRFRIIALVGTTDLQIERTNNSRGLQCQNALFSWKLIFSFEQQSYEIIMCACSTREEERWKEELSKSSKLDTTVPMTSDSTFLAINLRSLGLIFGQPGSLARRMSLQQTEVLDTSRPGCEVIIRNTHSAREGQDFPKSASASFNRSTSLLLSSRIPVLSPDRVDRVRLEHALEDVWTKATLPFPGMTVHRMGDFVRVSKKSVMRKLSKASTNTPTEKHSFSCNSLDDPFIEGPSPKENHQAVSRVDAERETTPTSTLRLGTEYDLTLPEALATEGSAQPQMTDAMKISFNVPRTPRSRISSEALTVAEEDERKEDKPDKPKKGKTLLKAFSAEGMRMWFT